MISEADGWSHSLHSLLEPLVCLNSMGIFLYKALSDQPNDPLQTQCFEMFFPTQVRFPFSP